MWSFITVFTKVCNLSLHWTILIQSTPSLSAFSFISVRFSHLHLGLRSGIFHLNFQPKFVCFYHLCCMVHASYLDLMNNSTWRTALVADILLMYRSMLQATPTFLTSSDNFLGNFFSDILNLCCSRLVKDPVSHSFEANSQMRMLCVVVRGILDRRRENKILGNEW
jgi:hypothetical protein